MTVPAERLAEAVAAAGPVLVDVGCGDGRHTVRWAERRPDALVVGLDAETTRLDRAVAAARKRKLGGRVRGGGGGVAHPSRCGRGAPRSRS